MKGKEFINLYVKDGRILPNDVEVIDGSLDLKNCEIKKIENLPKQVNGLVCLSENKIKILENLPEIINGDLFLGYNNITEIKSIPKYVKYNIWLSNNPISKKYIIWDYQDLKRVFKLQLLEGLL